MNSSTHPNPVQPFPFAKFLPGLVLGVVLGSFATAFVTPIAETWARLPADPAPRGQANGFAGPMIDAAPVETAEVPEFRETN